MLKLIFNQYSLLKSVVRSAPIKIKNVQTILKNFVSVNVYKSAVNEIFLTLWKHSRFIFLGADLFRFNKAEVFRMVQKLSIFQRIMVWNRLIILLVFQTKSIKNTNVSSFAPQWSCMSLVVRCCNCAPSQMFFVLFAAENLQGVSFASLLVLGWRCCYNWRITFV